jgi:S1-C subfamily serine protease
MKRLAFAILCIALFGCESAPPVKPVPTPAPVTLGPEGSETISFAKVIIRMPTGTHVGTIYVRSGDKDSRPIYWKSNLTFSEDEFRPAAIDELQRYGFSVLGADEALFGQPVKYEPRFLLGGVLTDLAYDKYLEDAGNYTRTSLAVDWQLYDTQQQKSIFHKSVRADAQLKGDQSTATIFLAFNRALEALLTNKQFVDLVSKKSGQPSSAAPARTEAYIAVEPCVARTMALPDDIASVQQSIVEIRAQDNVGSGVLISKDGLVVTAARWVRDAKTATVALKSGLTMEAEIVRVAGDADLALLKVAGSGYPCLTLLADSTPLVGQQVYAIGNTSVTKGVLSALKGEGADHELQIDAGLSVGNVGGPILSRSGEILGIVTLKGSSKGIDGVPSATSASAVQEALKLSMK